MDPQSGVFPPAEAAATVDSQIGASNINTEEAEAFLRAALSVSSRTETEPLKEEAAESKTESLVPPLSTENSEKLSNGDGASAASSSDPPPLSADPAAERKALLRLRLQERIEAAQKTAPASAALSSATSSAAALTSSASAPPVDNTDEVEGFTIVSDERPGLVPAGPPQEEFLHPPEFNRPPLPKSYAKSPSSSAASSSSSPSTKKSGPPGYPVFGPQIIKQALIAMGGRATAVAIAEWVAQNKPHYLHYFGNQKKLRYSVSGILSARTYSGIFQKRVVISKGVRKSDWILLDTSSIPEEQQAQLRGVEEEQLTEDTVSGLLSLSEASVKTPYPPEPNSPSASTEEENEPYEIKTCQVCHRDVDDDKLLLCDNCDLGFHMYCLTPPLEIIPHGAWYCEYCIPYLRRDSDSELMEDELGQEDEFEGMDYGNDSEGESSLVSPRACEKHRRWKKRCPDNCPMRSKIKPGTKPKWGRRGQKPWRAPRYGQRDGWDSDSDRRRRVSREADMPTYIEMIEEAISSFGGSATTPDITTFMEDHHGELLATKTKTWRNSVSGCLSTHFVRSGKDRLGRTVWSNQRTPGEKRPRDPKFKLPSRSSFRFFDPERLAELQTKVQTFGPPQGTSVEYINRSHPLDVQETALPHPGAVMAMALAGDGERLATVSSLGSIRIWNLGDEVMGTGAQQMIAEIRDSEETNVEEFYSVCWSPNDDLVITSGKLKDRKRWNETNDDHLALSPAIKIFDVITGKVVQRLEGHTKDILCLRVVSFNGQWHLLSASQDGTIRKWTLSDDFRSVTRSVVLADDRTDMAIHLDFIPKTGNKFFVACCDGGLKIFDFETEQVVQTFPDLYGYLCDFVQFVECKEILIPSSEEFFLITRGVELLDENEKVVQPNTCHLRKLTIPSGGRGKFRIDEVNAFAHEDYHANIWLLRLATNGRYILAPTTEGKVFVWNVRSRELVAILRDHENREVREIKFHPSKRLILSCGDDSTIRVYTQKEYEGEVEPDTIQSLEAVMGYPEKEESPSPISHAEEEKAVEVASSVNTPNLRKKRDRRHFNSDFLMWDKRFRFDDDDLYEEDSHKAKSRKPKKEKTSSPIPSTGDPEFDMMFKRRGRGLPGACEKHKREHMKCSADCPNRKLKIPQFIRTML